MNFLQRPLLAFFIALAIFMGAGCGRRPSEAPAADASSGAQEDFGESADEGDDVWANPSLQAAKAEMKAGRWDLAAEAFRKLLDDEAPIPLFANELGICLLRSGDLPGAADAFKKAISLDSEYPRAWYNLGLVESRQEHDEAAIAAYARAVELNTNHYEAWYNLGLLHYRAGDFASARRAFETVAERTRSARFNRVHYQLGLVAVGEGMDEEGKAHYAESLLLDPSHVPSYLNLAAIALRAQSPGEAKDLLMRAAELAPKETGIWWNLGLAEVDLGNDAAAAGHFQKVIALVSGHAAAYLNLAAIAMRANRHAEAREYLETARSLDARNPKILWNLGRLAADEGKDEEAIRWWNEGLEYAPDDPDLYLNLAAAFLRKKDYTEAAYRLEQAATIAPEDFRIAWNRGLIARAEGREDAAREAFARVLELKPDYHPARFNLGLSEYRAGNLTAAEKHFYRSAYGVGDEPYPEAHYMLGKILSDRGEHNAAINEYETAWRLRPDYVEAAYNLALNLDRMGEREAGEKIYRELGARENAPAEALNNLAIRHLEGDDPAGAIPFLQRALKSDPEYATAAYNLGLARLRLEHFEAATASFSRSLEIDPSSFAAWKNQGIAFARLERWAEAAESMAEAQALRPDDPDTAVYRVRYLKEGNASSEVITETYKIAYAAGVRHPLPLKHLAGAAVASGDDARACELYREYLKIRPSPVYAYNLGLALRRLDRLEEAEAAYRQALMLRPGYAKAWLNLGYIRAYRGDPVDARTCFEKALALDPAYDNAREALSELERGGIQPLQLQTE